MLGRVLRLLVEPQLLGKFGVEFGEFARLLDERLPQARSWPARP
jgi:hypothetical protein